MRLFLPIAMLAGLAALAALPAPGEPEREAAGGLSIVIGTGGVRAAGQLPRGVRPKALRNAVPGIEFADGLGGDGPGDPAAWRRAIDALTVAVPRLDAGQVRIHGRQFDVSGRLRPGFSAAAARSALRLMLGGAWDLSMSVEEVPPAAVLKLSRTGSAFAIDGILPAGLGPREAMVYLAPALEGTQVGETPVEALTGGGRGDADAWRRALDALGTIAPLFSDLDARLGGRQVTVAGTLRPGYEGAKLASWMSRQLAEGWTLEMAALPTPAVVGTVRRYPFDGQPELLTHGHWLPVFRFRPGPVACAGHSRSALGRGGIAFTPGGVDISPQSGPVLDRLAGIALRCIRDGGLRLLIGGHTDNRGPAAGRLALSGRRAEAVRDALADRGVPAEAIDTRAYGDTLPLASNDTPAGRAQNRRITFDWSL